MTLYHEEMSSPLMWFFLVLMAAIIALIIMFPEKDEDPELAIIIIAVVFTVLVVMFRGYSITIDEKYLILRFGVIRSKIKIGEITSYKKRKLSRWFTFGMKTDLKNYYYLPKPGGGDAIEVNTSKGKYYLFSTKYPDRVMDALKTASGVQSQAHQ